MLPNTNRVGYPEGEEGTSLLRGREPRAEDMRSSPKQAGSMICEGAAGLGPMEMEKKRIDA